MLREKVIIVNIPITQAGQIQHFQVKIPRNALRIIGVELSGFYAPQTVQKETLRAATIASVQPTINNTVQYTASPFVGDVRLQSCEKTNIFYSGDVYLSDANVGYGDYSATAQFPATSATHGWKWGKYVVDTEGKTTILKGIYRDRQKAAQPLYTYTAKVYVWYEIKNIQA